MLVIKSICRRGGAVAAIRNAAGRQRQIIRFNNLPEYEICFIDRRGFDDELKAHQARFIRFFLACFIDFVELHFMNCRHEMFKYQEIQAITKKVDVGNNNSPLSFYKSL
jgi:hypothetical protein